TGLQFIFETRARNHFHRVEKPSLFFAVAIEPNDSIVAERLERFDFRLKPLAKSVDLRQMRVQRFDRHLLARIHVGCRVDRAHSPFADRFLDAIRAELGRLHHGFARQNPGRTGRASRLTSSYQALRAETRNTATPDQPQRAIAYSNGLECSPGFG